MEKYDTVWYDRVEIYAEMLVRYSTILKQKSEEKQGILTRWPQLQG